MNKKSILPILCIVSLLFALSSPWGMTINLWAKVYNPVSRYEIFGAIRYAYYQSDSHSVHICFDSRFFDEKKIFEQSLTVSIEDFIQTFNYDGGQLLNDRLRNIGVFQIVLPQSSLRNGCLNEEEIVGNEFNQVELGTFDGKTYLAINLTGLYTVSEFGSVLGIEDFRGFIYVSPKKLRDSSFYQNSKIVPQNSEGESYILFTIDYEKRKEVTNVS